MQILEARKTILGYYNAEKNEFSKQTQLFWLTFTIKFQWYFDSLTIHKVPA